MVTVGKRNRHAILIRHLRAGDGPHTFASRDDACEVERIGGADDQHVIIGRSPPDLAQPIHCIGERELLAGHPGNKSPAANLAAGFETPVHARQFAPGGGIRLA